MAGVLESVFEWVSRILHYQPDATMLAFALIAFLTLPRKKIFATAFVLTLVLALGAKQLYAEPRPCVSAPALVECPSDYGLPSSHAALAVLFPLAALGTSLFYLFAPIALLVWVSRIYLGVHSLQQVGAGIALGAVVYLLVSQLLRKFGEKSERNP